MPAPDSVLSRWIGRQGLARAASGRAAAPSDRTPGDGASAEHAPNAYAPGMWASGLARQPRTRGALRRFLVDFVRSSVIGLALITAVPLVYLASRDGLRPYDTNNARERIADVDRLRALMVPRDAWITAEEAGRALNALRAPLSRTSATVTAMLQSESFPMHPVPTPYVRPWQLQTKTIGIFPAPSGGLGMAGVTASMVVMQATGGFSPEEMMYLRAVAEAPIWRDVERVASAAQVDMIGGQFVLPFTEEAFAPEMPITRFSDSKALAYAGVSRAAYYLALGDAVRAEAALRTVLSFGFVFIDNGTSLMDALIGRAIIDIGRTGLHQLYDATGNTRGLALAAPLPKHASQMASRATTQAQADAISVQRLADANDSGVPRTIRFARMQELAFSSCGSVREVLTGPRDEVRESFARASQTLARFPSERAYLQLLQDAPSRGNLYNGMRGRVDALITGAATVAATVLHNQRIATCTQLTLALQ